MIFWLHFIPLADRKIITFKLCVDQVNGNWLIHVIWNPGQRRIQEFKWCHQKSHTFPISLISAYLGEWVSEWVFQQTAWQGESVRVFKAAIWRLFVCLFSLPSSSLPSKRVFVKNKTKRKNKWRKFPKEPYWGTTKTSIVNSRFVFWQVLFANDNNYR